MNAVCSWRRRWLPCLLRRGHIEAIRLTPLRPRVFTLVTPPIKAGPHRSVTRGRSTYRKAHRYPVHSGGATSKQARGGSAYCGCVLLKLPCLFRWGHIEVHLVLKKVISYWDKIVTPPIRAGPHRSRVKSSVIVYLLADYPICLYGATSKRMALMVIGMSALSYPVYLDGATSK